MGGQDKVRRRSRRGKLVKTILTVKYCYEVNVEFIRSLQSPLILEIIFSKLLIQIRKTE